VREMHLLPMTGYELGKALKWRLSVSCVILADRR
jgi:hypothetical protein